MRRWEFFGPVGGAVVTWPLATRAQRALLAARFSRVAAAIVASLLLAGPVAANPLPRTVLLIDQYSGSLPWVGIRNAAFRTQLHVGRAGPISIYEEFLDLNRFAASQFKESLSHHFSAKYREKPIGLIVAFGPLALEYAIHIRADLWPSAPVVFGEIAESALSRSGLPPAVTGTTINITLGEMVVAARALVPDLKRIAIVGDSLESLPAYRHFRDEIPIVTHDLEYIDITGLSMADMRKRVATLPDNTAIIYTTINLDRSGVSYVPAEALSLIAEVANRPIVVGTETFLGRGAVGGFVVSPRTVGQDAARLASRIFDGEDASIIAATTNGVNNPVFDWRQMQRWGISESSLPAGSEILFRDPSLWEQYRTAILTVIAALLLQAMLITWLIYERWRRQAAESGSHELINELARMNRFATAGELSASIAHEIRQPLAAIATFGSTGLIWLKKQVPDLDEVRNVLQSVVKESHRADDIIKGIRAMFRHESPKRTPVDLNELVQQVITITARTMDSNNIVLDSNLVDDPPPFVMGDPVQLQQVILNLVMNAVEAMSHAGHSPRMLRLRAELDPAGTVVMRVIDSGPSVDPKVVEKMFQPFFTTKPGGMGMGLSICRTIIEAHGGSLTASPNNPHGMEFQIVLPHCRYP